MPAEDTRGTALIVDDDPDFRSSFARFINSFGWTAHAAADAAEALAICRESKPWLIFVDLQMPDRDGFETCADLRAERFCHHATIVAMSGTASNFLQERAFSAGFDLYFLKPISEPLLRGVLEAVQNIRRD
jgi:two-component system, chemotaxis family, chemotaxis protein CheY